jgi:hypothetical protein
LYAAIAGAVARSFSRRQLGFILTLTPHYPDNRILRGGTDTKLIVIRNYALHDQPGETNPFTASRRIV